MKNWLRRYFIRLLIGRMSVCVNMTIVNGYIEYDGRHGSTVVDNNQYLTREGNS